jgi:hypothetical protein
MLTSIGENESPYGHVHGVRAEEEESEDAGSYAGCVLCKYHATNTQSLI